MGCCYEPPDCKQRSILPKRLVLPVRIIVLASLVASSMYILRHMRDLSAIAILGLFFHLVIAARALGECKKSIYYHRLMDEFEQKIADQD